MVSGTCNRCRIVGEDVFHVSGSTTGNFIDILNENGQNIADCVTVTTEVVRTFPEIIEYDECGCPIDHCGGASLKITIGKGVTTDVVCNIKGFSFDPSGLIQFQTSTETTFNIDAACCESLGYTTDVDENGEIVCRWKDKPTVDCSDYVAFRVVNGYHYFSNANGPDTLVVPSADCCPVGSRPELTNGGYKCAVK